MPDSSPPPAPWSLAVAPRDHCILKRGSPTRTFDPTDCPYCGLRIVMVGTTFRDLTGAAYRTGKHPHTCPTEAALKVGRRYAAGEFELYPRRDEQGVPSPLYAHRRTVE